MLVLLMASALRDQLRSVVFEDANELAELHSPIVPTPPTGRRRGFPEEPAQLLSVEVGVAEDPGECAALRLPVQRHEQEHRPVAM